MKEGRLKRDELRLLRFLSAGPARVGATSDPARLLLQRQDDPAVSAKREMLDDLVAAGALSLDGGEVAVRSEGRARLRRLMTSGAEGHAGQHREMGESPVRTQEGWQRLAVNCAESPLVALSRRRTASGEPFLSAGELRAGERLRRDYGKGMIMARMGVDWSSAGAGAGGRRDGNAAAELTDMALAARQRVDRAILAVGPELAGVLIDVCCFLKGLERVERERGWPARSAKIVLKSALAALFRHYEPRVDGRVRRTLLHWGAEGYRPTMQAG